MAYTTPEFVAGFQSEIDSLVTEFQNIQQEKTQQLRRIPDELEYLDVELRGIQFIANSSFYANNDANSYPNYANSFVSPGTFTLKSNEEMLFDSTSTLNLNSSSAMTLDSSSTLRLESSSTLTITNGTVTVTINGGNVTVTGATTTNISGQLQEAGDRVATRDWVTANFSENTHTHTYFRNTSGYDANGDFIGVSSYSANTSQPST